jgi:hypothetical protein
LALGLFGVKDEDPLDRDVRNSFGRGFHFVRMDAHNLRQQLRHLTPRYEIALGCCADRLVTRAFVIHSNFVIRISAASAFGHHA